MTELLLDTHVVLWAVSEPERLSQAAHDALSSPSNALFVSSISAIEIEVKRSIGKLALQVSCRELAASIGADWLDVNVRHAEQLRGLPLLHRDPFDRVLVAQAQAEQWVLVSADESVLRYDVATITA